MGRVAPLVKLAKSRTPGAREYAAGALRFLAYNNAEKDAKDARIVELEQQLERVKRERDVQDARRQHPVPRTSEPKGLRRAVRLVRNTLFREGRDQRRAGHVHGVDRQADRTTGFDDDS